MYNIQKLGLHFQENIYLWNESVPNKRNICRMCFFPTRISTTQYIIVNLSELLLIETML